MGPPAKDEDAELDLMGSDIGAPEPTEEAREDLDLDIGR